MVSYAMADNRSTFSSSLVLPALNQTEIPRLLSRNGHAPPQLVKKVEQEGDVERAFAFFSVSRRTHLLSFMPRVLRILSALDFLTLRGS